VNLFQRLRHRRDLARADKLIQRARRPHVQSVHMVSYPVERAHEYKIGPRYVALLLAVLGLVSLINYFKG
jgi:hypothetical protein